MSFKLRPINKKAITGNAIATVVATLAVILILFIFVIVSFFIKEFTGVKSETPKEGEVGLAGINNYFNNFNKFVYFRFLFNQNSGKGVNLLIQEAGYEK